MLRKYFIPNNKNEHKPHILRRKAVFGILGVALFAELLFLIHVFLVLPSTGLFSAILPNVLVDLTNADRKENNVGFLDINDLLQKAALLKAQDMAQKGYFAHTAPDGKNPWYWLEKVGYNYEYAGENLAVNFVDSSDIEKAFMDSTGHRANILNGNFSEIGVATARGMYKGQETEFVVQFFGKPFPAKMTVSNIVPTQAPIKIINPPQEMTVFKKSEGGSVAGETKPVQKIPETPNNLSASWLEKILSMPRWAMIYFNFALLAFVLLALGLKIFIKIQIQHPGLILNGVLILFVILSILYLNSMILKSGVVF